MIPKRFNRLLARIVYGREVRRINGPYLHKQTDRYYVVITFQNGIRFSTLYARFLMCMHLRHKLDKYKDVHHIDDNIQNDIIENLKVIKKATHASNHHTKTQIVRIPCVICGKMQKRKARTIRHNGKQGKAGPFCGYKCRGTYTRMRNKYGLKLKPQSVGLILIPHKKRLVLTPINKDTP